MKKETAKEWMALCRTCTWSGKRSKEQATAQIQVETHLKTHPKHNVRLLVTGEDSTPAPSKQESAQQEWNRLTKRQEER